MRCRMIRIYWQQPLRLLRELRVDQTAARSLLMASPLGVRRPRDRYARCGSTRIPFPQNLTDRDSAALKFLLKPAPRSLPGAAFLISMTKASTHAILLL